MSLDVSCYVPLLFNVSRHFSPLSLFTVFRCYLMSLALFYYHLMSLNISILFLSTVTYFFSAIFYLSSSFLSSFSIISYHLSLSLFVIFYYYLLFLDILDISYRF